MSRELANYLISNVGVSDIYEIRSICKIVGAKETQNAIEDIIFYGEYETKDYLLVREDKIAKPDKSGEQVLKELERNFKELFLGVFRIFAVAK